MKAGPVASASAPAPQAATVPAAPPSRASAPAPAPDDEPPPWLDVPYEDELPAVSLTAREPEARVTPAAAVAPAFVPTPLGDRWAELVGRMTQAGTIGALVRELAMQAQCVSADEGSGTWRLRVERETLRAQAQRDKLQAALSELLQRPVRLEVEAGPATDTPAQRAAAERARRQDEAEQIIHNDPLVQALMKQFKTARIVPGSVKPH
jgi:DNA polymerase-3 subunit gamma/tau